MTVTRSDQMGLDEKVVESTELERALEARLNAKNEESTARHNAKVAHEAVLAQIGELDLENGDVVRIGRFRITKTAVQSRSVAFETSPTSRLQISLIED